ncbi:MAG: hypothetical protein HC915_09490, partial [Anaerolineae bacterium]|nr:hypothetical protein [Anaerolineae bacterium]
MTDHPAPDDQLAQLADALLSGEPLPAHTLPPQEVEVLRLLLQATRPGEQPPPQFRSRLTEQVSAQYGHVFQDRNRLLGLARNRWVGLAAALLVTLGAFLGLLLSSSPPDSSSGAATALGPEAWTVGLLVALALRSLQY